jgi:hypothetical protein
MISKLCKAWPVFFLIVSTGAVLNIWAIAVAMAVPNRGLIGSALNLTPYLAYWPNSLVGRGENEWFDPDFGISILVNVAGWILLGSLGAFAAKWWHLNHTRQP